MSRHAAAVFVAALLGAAPAPALAQIGPADPAIEAARAAYGPQPPRPQCPSAQESDEIVVCAEEQEQEQEQFHYSGNEAAKERYARETMYKGAPRAPNVAGPGIFHGPGIGLGKAPEPAYFIDFAELPDTPPGSDADRMGRGLAPNGGRTPAVLGEPVSPPGSASPAEAPSGSPSPPAEQSPE